MTKLFKKFNCILVMKLTTSLIDKSETPVVNTAYMDACGTTSMIRNRTCLRA